ncbi:MAG: HupE/UreJ family protein [Rhizobiaceae bacterium]
MVRHLLAQLLFATVLAVAGFGTAAPLHAHTLGIDKAELTELNDGSYRLVSRVPVTLAPFITTPQLPERCSFTGPRAGERGAYEVRFSFTCTSPLIADDKIELPWRREGAMLSISWRSGAEVTRLVERKGETITIDLALFQAGSGSWLDAARRYTLLGIEHILSGFDHLLFVLGLLFLVRGAWMLVKTITAFTVAHSITLALATLGILKVPSAPVEAAIALSIVFLAVEIVKGWRGQFSITHQMPWLVAFAFGLLHGLGFAGALSELGLPPDEIPIALLFFNIGVEVGQLIFVAIILVAIWAWRHARFPAPRSLALAPAYAIGTLAAYWFLERAAVMFVPA